MSCKIYFIQCLETNEIYIGSTKQKYLCDRIAGHVFDAKYRSKGSPNQRGTKRISKTMVG